MNVADSPHHIGRSIDEIAKPNFNNCSAQILFRVSTIISATSWEAPVSFAGFSTPYGSNFPNRLCANPTPKPLATHPPLHREYDKHALLDEFPSREQTLETSRGASAWPLAARASRMFIRSGSDREEVTRRIDWLGRIVRPERTL
jgi:hypothetical protein